MSLAALALAAVAAAAPAAPPAIPAQPTRWVEDHAAMLSPAARDALDARLAGYERATGHQVVVWIGRTIGGAPLDDWAVRTFAAWQLGRKGIDDGVAIFVLADDRAIDIEVGYGLEDRIPDAIASRIIREVMAPRLRAGDRDGAVTAGASAVLTAIEGKPWAGAPAGAGAGAGTASHDDGPSTISWVFGGLIGLVFLVLFITHPRLALMLLWSILSGGRGGFGGGGGGGFSGGGGRSGGGGARGGW
jgi:uncharacterized protein